MSAWGSAKIRRLRLAVQLLWAAATNSYLPGYAGGTISKLGIKSVCAPGLNCYSCPGALLSCPIGALQSVIGSRSFRFSFYVVGALMVMGATLGRFICGWLCPFGMIQGLLNRIPFFKKVKTFRGDRVLRYAKYLFLAVFVVLLPLFLVDAFGQGAPYFCQYICPAGTLEAGIPLVLANPVLRELTGWLYNWKLFILGAVVLGSIIIYRPFCKYICPLGAVYSLLNPVSALGLRLDEDKCVRCGRCSEACKMNVSPCDTPRSPECIRCGDCVGVCPAGALHIGVKAKVNDNKVRKAGV